MAIALHTLAFLATLVGAFLIPGWVWWRAVFGRTFSVWEEIVYAFLGSIALIDLLMLVFGRVGLPLSATSIGGALFILTALGGALVWRNWSRPTDGSGLSGLHFSRRGALIGFGLLALTFFIRTIYLAPNILPTATDLGHHAYWADIVTNTLALPTYEKIEVVTDPTTGASSVAAPRAIADFIIGEHLPFAFFAELSRLTFFSAFPILFLHLVNLLSIIAVIALAYRLARPLAGKIEPEHVALFVLLILGPLFALASPQAKFVTGGVVGNIFGNLFIPAILLLFYRALTEKKSSLLAAGLFFAFTLAYTHHLSTLVLAFVLIGTGILISVSLLFTREPFLRDWIRLIRSPAVISFLVLAGSFMALVALPSYLDTAAIDSAIGTPTKTTRTGLSFLQVSNAIGTAKVALGLFGILLLLGLFRRRSIEAGFLLGWSGFLLVMAMFPQFLFLDIPSSRIGSYLSYPLALSAGFALAWLSRTLSEKTLLPFSLRVLIATTLIVFLVGSGSSDNASSLTFKDRSKELVQTFAAADYLAQHAGDEMILKDHNYLTADAWIKLFFHRDYGYPLSRGLFGRYEEGGNRRERCTLAMISTPNTAAGEKCFNETGVRYLLVNPNYDNAQFEKSDSFSKLYTSGTAAIYERNQ